MTTYELDDIDPDRCMFWLCVRDKHTGNETVRPCYRTAREGSAYCWQHFEQDGDYA